MASRLNSTLGIHFDWESGEVRQNSSAAMLSRQQSDLMEILWRCHPRPARKEAIVSQLYGAADEPATAEDTVRVQVAQLRRKLTQAAVSVNITTVRSVGYRLDFAPDATPIQKPLGTQICTVAVLDEFLTSLDAATDAMQMGQALTRAAQQLGFTYTGYQLVAVPGIDHDGPLPLFVSDIPAEWARDYVNHDLVKHDPAVRAAMMSSNAFTWHTSEVVDAIDDETIASMARRVIANGILGGFTVPIHDADGTRALVNFLVTVDKAEAIRLVENNGPLLRLIASHLHSHILPPMRAAAEERLGPQLTETEIAFLGTKMAEVCANVCDCEGGCGLIRKKLGANSCIQAVVKAMRLGLIKMATFIVALMTLVAAVLDDEQLLSVDENKDYYRHSDAMHNSAYGTQHSTRSRKRKLVCNDPCAPFFAPWECGTQSGTVGEGRG
ncbi:autoinducer binding domain-containing protein [Magnetospirillum molischianum]|uniref:autoinducer binding domain-containing protein n=1 Tax=Magnetospirillum molischianum TaxID=1083 RepID=UPI00138B0DC0|nr:autoinducer binding domain-containing protein [Magnetospirillum molischianum]